ncbi:UNVERIFIED_CONTAM: hypothetical protein Sradi_1771600 [Sesamum radiatum]|uniref:Uncharacterized protein n=1 Tax=Sesamum radiatum TaxID=300843 RepID=A0AAW2TUY9_SESRA
MRYKSWPFFLAWREIFGKDRAVEEVTIKGHPSVNAADTEVDIETHEYYVPTAEWCPGVGYVGNDTGAAGDNPDNAERNVISTASEKKATSSGKKRKRCGHLTDDGLTDAVMAFCDTANQRLSEISKKLFVDYEEVEKRSAVYAAVGSISGIDLND